MLRTKITISFNFGSILILSLNLCIPQYNLHMLEVLLIDGAISGYA